MKRQERRHDWRSLHAPAPPMARGRRTERAGRRPRHFGSLDENVRRRARRAAAAVLLALELAGLVALVVAPAFQVRRIEVSGNRRLSAAEVVAAAGLQHPGTVFLVDPQAVQARVDAMTWVRSSAVTAQLPDAVEIRVEEWLPVAVYQAGSGPPYDLSDQAVVLGAATAADLGALPVVDGPAEPAPRPGRAPVDRTLLIALINVRRALPGLIGQGVRSFAIDACGNLTMTVERGWTVQFGGVLTPEEVQSLKPKLASLKALYVAGDVDFDSADLQYVNVMNPSDVAVKQRTAPARTASGRPASQPATC